MATRKFKTKRIPKNANLVRVLRHVLKRKNLNIHELKLVCNLYCRKNQISNAKFMGIVSQAWSHNLIQLDSCGNYYL